MRNNPLSFFGYQIIRDQEQNTDIHPEQINPQPDLLFQMLLTIKAGNNQASLTVGDGSVLCKYQKVQFCMCNCQDPSIFHFGL